MRHWHRGASACVLAVLGLSGLLVPGDVVAMDLDGDTPALTTPWLPAERRIRVGGLDVALKDQDSRPRVLSVLVDRPALVTFFYTRCQNMSKCSTTITQLALLQQQLVRAGIQDKVRLLAITYEPQFDTPEKLSRFASERGLKLGEHALAIQLDSIGQQRLLDNLATPVNFNAGWVNTHGVEANLLDAKGRLVRKYSTLLWKNDQVASDLKRLLAER